VQFSNTEDRIHKTFVVELGHVLFYLAQHGLVLHLGKELFIKVSASQFATSRELLNKSSRDEWNIVEVWLGDIEQRKGLMCILESIFYVVQIFI
jgi:hypothetical protein